MSNYSSEHLTIGKLIGRSFTNYGKTFKAVLVFIILAALVQDNYLFFWGVKLSHWGFGLLLGAVSVVAIYFWSAAIIAADGGIKSTPHSMGFCFKHALTKLIKVVVVAGFYVLLFIGSSYWMRFIADIAKHFKHLAAAQGLINLIFVGLPLLVLFLLFLLSIPKILTDDEGLFKSMGHSAKIVWKARFKPALALYVGSMLLLFLTIPTTKHAAWLIAHHIKLPFDLLILIFSAPIIINFMLFILNNPAPIIIKRAPATAVAEEDI